MEKYPGFQLGRFTIYAQPAAGISFQIHNANRDANSIYAVHVGLPHPDPEPLAHILNQLNQGD